MAVALVMSGFGLSAFFFSSISHMLFPGNTSDFLLVLGLGTSIPMIFGFFFVRRMPLPSHGVTGSYQPLATSGDLDECQHHDSSSTPFQSQSEVNEEGGSHERTLQHSPRRHSGIPNVPLSETVELFSSNDLETHDKPSGFSLPAQDHVSDKIVEGRGVDLYRWTLVKSVDFWIMCSIHSLCELSLVYWSRLLF